MQASILSGRYELIRRIGRGGMADVWEGRDIALGREVAVKILHSGFASDPRFVERFRREAQAAARLNHPNIAGIYDWGEITAPVPGYFIVMQLVHGENVREILQRRGPLPEAEALDIGGQVAAALDAAHHQGLVHRDIKPHNILIDETGHVEVVDFGIVHAIGVSDLTQTGAVAGTPQYLSPEQAQHLPLDGRSDLYSLGVVLYEMLVGRPPFVGDSMIEVAMQHLRDIPIPPREIRPEISPATNAIVMKALAKNPNERFDSAAEMRQAMVGVMSGAQTASDDTVPNVLVERRSIPVPEPVAEPVAEPIVATARTASTRRTESHDFPRAAAPTATRRPLAPPVRRGLSPFLLLIPLLILLGAAALAYSHFGAGTGGHTAGGGSQATPRPSRIAGGGVVAHRTPTRTPRPTIRPTRTSAPAPTGTHPVAAPPVPTATKQPLPTATSRPAPTPTSLPAPTITSAPVVTQPTSPPRGGTGVGSPTAAVEQFYSDVAYHNWGAAQSLWSSHLLQNCPPASCISDRFSVTSSLVVNSVTLESQSGGSATVGVDLTETLTSGKTTHYVGSWYLVKGSSGWLLDSPALSVAAGISSGAALSPPTTGNGQGKAKGHEKVKGPGKAKGLAKHGAV
jgi:serine/threonine protein kinase